MDETARRIFDEVTVTQNMKKLCVCRTVSLY